MQQKSTTYILCALFVLVAALVQANSYLNTDSAWLVDSAHKLLSGKNLYTDYIETNPPFIVYFSAIPVWLGLMLGVPLYAAYQVFVMLLLIACVGYSFKFINSNFIKIIVTFGIFILPVQSYGQREHLLLALMLPYFFCLLEEKKPTLAAILLATLGFLIKPYFVIFFIGFALWQRKIFTRSNIITGCGLGLYGVGIYFFEHDYLTNVLPLLLQYYGEFYFMKTALHIKLLIFMLLVFVPVGFNTKSEIFNKKISLTIYAAFLGGLVLLAQNKGWTNHYLPLYFFIMLAIAMLIERTNGLLRGMLCLIFIGITSHASYINFMEICDAKKADSAEVIKLLQGREALPLSFNLSALYPELLYANARFEWEYPQLWMLVGMYEKSDIENKAVKYHAPAMQSADESRIFNSLVNYVADKKPRMVVVINSIVTTKKLGEFRFDFIKYFQQSPKFAAAFRNYHKIKQVGEKQIYILDPQEAATNIKLIRKR